MIVMTVPPAAGPLEGNTAMGTGSLKMGGENTLLTFAYLKLPKSSFTYITLALLNINKDMITHLVFRRKQNFN